MAASGIPYCDFSWNPYSGCTPELSCFKKCWAKKMAFRLAGRAGYARIDPFKPTYHPDKLTDLPKKPSVIAACYMGDLWCAGAKRPWQESILGVAMARTEHQFLFLTKRTKAMCDFFDTTIMMNPVFDHLWFGTSIMTNADNHRAETLAASGLDNIYLSIEPCYERITIHDGIIKNFACVIIGCESGPHPKEMPVSAAYHMADQCARLNIPLYVKQLTIKGKACTDINLWPKDLRIQQLPWRNANSIPTAGAT
jgi:protein gp37